MNQKNLNIDVEYLTRVEGHGNIAINVKDGKLEKCELQVIEAPRFFEAMVRERSLFEVQHITSRICGICSVAHSLASLRASEAAASLVVSPQTVLLRKLLLHFETLDSHLLHVYFLVAPDALGVPSVLPLVETHKDVVLRALRMKKQYSDLCDILAGRHTHPITVCPRGFTKLPTKTELIKMRDILKSQAEDLMTTVDIVKTIKLPDFERETEYVALTSNSEYAFYEGKLTSSDANEPLDIADYKQIVHEYHAEHSTAKHAKNKRASYMVGALARANLNFAQLNDQAKAVADALGFKVPCYSPFLNTIAQVVEMAHCYYDALDILECLIHDGINYDEAVSSWPNNDEWASYKVKAGSGVGAVEAPRGTLFHEYRVDERGIVQSANCVIPTNQNLANIDLDMKKMIPEILTLSKEEITLRAEMLVRAYDPCISCSCHMLNVEFI